MLRFSPEELTRKHLSTKITGIDRDSKCSGDLYEDGSTLFSQVCQPGLPGLCDKTSPMTNKTSPMANKTSPISELKICPRQTIYQRWDQVIFLQVPNKSQVFALKSRVKSQVKTGKSRVKSKVKTDKSQVQVLQFEF